MSRHLFESAQHERMDVLNDELDEMLRSGELQREADEIVSWEGGNSGVR